MKYTNIKLRRGTASEWQNSSPQPNGEILKLGEPGYEKDTGKLKIGDGINGWNNLPYINGGASISPEELQDLIGNEFLVAGNGINLDYNDGENTLTITNSKDTFDAAVEWTANHTLADGTRYLAGDLVYSSGNLYRAKFDNESLPVTNSTYWENVGPGYRLNIDGRDIPNIPSVDVGPQVQSMIVAGDGISISYGTAPDYDVTITASGNYATLENGKVPASQLPSYVDDVLEFATSGNFPNPGTSSIIYIALNTGKTYRWGDTTYFEIVASPGTTDSIIEGSNNLYFTTDRASNAAPVQSVNSKVGAVILNKSDIGLNTTDNLPEGSTNLYFSNQRVTDASPVKNIIAGNGIEISSTNQEFTISSLGSATLQVMNGRLSLSNTNPQILTDVTNANTLYYHPDTGNIVSLYDTNSSSWKYYTLNSVINLNLSGLLADTNYDIFLYNNISTLTLEAVAWSTSGAGSSLRNVNLSRQNGVLVRSGDLSKRYIGSLRTSGAGVCEDSSTKRYLYNHYNQIHKRLSLSNTNSHTYNSATIRPWDNNTNHGESRFSFIVGQQTMINIDMNSSLTPTTNGNRISAIVGLNSTTAGICGCLNIANSNAQTIRFGSSSYITSATGFNFIQALEQAGVGSGTFGNIFIVGTVFC